MSTTEVSPGAGATPASAPAAGGSRSIWSRIRRDALLLGGGNVMLVLAQLGFRGILIATLVPAEYGRLSLVLSIYNSAWIIGSSGLPNSVARYIAINGPAGDGAVIRAAIKAGAIPIGVATVLVGVASALVLQTPVAAPIGALGFCGLMYSLLSMGALRGRGRVGYAAAVMPLAGCVELLLLLGLWRSGLGVAPLSAFGIFAIGNLVGLALATYFLLRTRVRNAGVPTRPAPSPRELLSLSLWLALATGAVAILPLVVRTAATLDSFTVVAIVDVALVLFSIPQRLGTIIVLATTPHASKQVDEGRLDVAISRREHLLLAIPFLAAAAVVAFTPLVEMIFDAIGKPQYDESATYLALALLAGPPRILYGLVEGMLIAHGEGRFLAFNAVLLSVLASAAIFAAVAAGSTDAAFAAFVVAFWAIYLCGLQRVRALSRTPAAPR